jgi:biopolymer transport protein ExbD
MKQSLRAKRMAKRNKSLLQAPKLNLVSLMDIFTILVFFLLVNSGDVEVLQSDKNIKPPMSVSEQVPQNNLVVMVSSQDILVGGQKVADTKELIASKDQAFAPLTKELKYQAQKSGPLSPEKQLTGRPVTIMADKGLPYSTLKKVMATCALADYRDIALAVTQKQVSANDTSGGQP